MGSMKEQVYLEKLNQLKSQLQMLLAGTHHDYVLQLEMLRREHQKGTEFNKLCRQLEIERVERDCENEKTAALREFEEKRAELRESLITELEERRRQIEHEYQTMELTGDNVEVKPMKTRNLRRRYNDPAPTVDNKRSRKASPTLNLALSSSEVAEDLKLISAAAASVSASMPDPDDRPVITASTVRSISPDGVSTATGGGGILGGTYVTTSHHGGGPVPTTTTTMDVEDGGDGGQGWGQSTTTIDVVIDDGKLIYQNKSYTRGQPVYVEMPPDTARTAAVVQTIGLRDLTLRLSNGKRMHVTLSQLQQGKCILLRRPA